MPEETISTEGQESILAFCRKISVTYDLDEEIQEELYGHIEDKLLGYLSGEEKLTEGDAFVLVCEHFGDSDSIRELLNEVHCIEPKRSLNGEVVFRTSLIIICGMIIAWFISGYYITTVIKLADTANLQPVYNKIMEPLTIKLQITYVLGILIVLPFISVYILLYKFPQSFLREKKRVFTMASIAVICVLTGVFFSSMFVLPYMLKMASPFLINGTHLSMSRFVSSILRISISFGLFFELPLLAYILTKIGILKHIWLSKNRKYAIVAIFLLGAVVTPPDPLSQIMIAVPLIIIFEISLRVVRLAERKSFAGIV